jgi:hypothetical protein
VTNLRFHNGGQTQACQVDGSSKEESDEIVTG